MRNGEREHGRPIRSEWKEDKQTNFTHNRKSLLNGTCVVWNICMISFWWNHVFKSTVQLAINCTKPLRFHCHFKNWYDFTRCQRMLTHTNTHYTERKKRQFIHFIYTDWSNWTTEAPKALRRVHHIEKEAAKWMNQMKQTKLKTHKKRQIKT